MDALNMGEYNPIEANYVAQVNRNLDIELMKEATKVMIGCHNYASFCAQDPYGNTYRTIYDIKVQEVNSKLEICFLGDGFRRYMIRYLMGALIRVGMHKWSIEQVRKWSIVQDK